MIEVLEALYEAYREWADGASFLRAFLFWLVVFVILSAILGIALRWVH